MTFTNDERKALYARLADTPNPDPSQARELAETILLADLDRLEEDVRRELTQLMVEAERNKDHASRMYYKFLAPAPDGGKPKLVNSGKDVDWYAKPQRQVYKVQVRHMKQFCKAHKLNEKDMHLVGMGELESHRGWERTSDIGELMQLGRPFQKPREEVPAADGRKEVRYLFQWAPKPIDWTPGQDK